MCLQWVMNWEARRMNLYIELKQIAIIKSHFVVLYVNQWIANAAASRRWLVLLAFYWTSVLRQPNDILEKSQIEYVQHVHSECYNYGDFYELLCNI